MHINKFDHYQHQASIVHRLDPRTKLILTIIFIVSNVLLPDGAWLSFFVSWLFVLVVSQVSGIKLSFILTRGLIALPFALAAITTMFTIPGEPALAVQAGPWLVVVTKPGLIRFVSIMLRSWISVQMAITLTATTSFPDLLHGMRHLKIPDILVSIVSFMYRYIFVLADEVLRLLRAREARSAGREGVREGGAVLWRARVAGNMAGQLFLRSYERSDRVYNAMLARGYQGYMLTMNAHVMTQTDWMVGVGFCLAIGILQLITRI